MDPTPLNIVLADDDQDDCIFFKEVLADLQVTAKLTIVNDGVQLMRLLNSPGFIMPDAIYLDLNMPRKNGFDCLNEIKQNGKLSSIFVFIFSTSCDKEVVNLLHEQGANYYIQKPAEFSNLKKVIEKSLSLIYETSKEKPLSEDFVISPSH